MCKHALVDKALGMVAIVVTAFALPASAQQSGNHRDPEAAQRGSSSNGEEMTKLIDPLDRYMLNQLTQINDDEITRGRLAQRQASSPEVRTLAAQVIEDQAGIQKRLQAFSGATTGAAGPAALSQKDSTARHPDEASRFVSLMQKAGREAEQSLTRELSQLRGRQFDRQFIYSQLFMDLRLIDWLTAFERNASAGLKPILQQWIQVAQYHIIRAEELAMRSGQMASAGPAAGGIFGPATGAAGSGAAGNGTRVGPRARIGLSPLPMTTQSPRGSNGGSP